MRRSYRIARRSFLAGIGGAFGLKVLLRNIEASAQGTAPPPRFLLTHWPVGTIRYHFVPTGTGTGWTASRILQPFADADLQGDMTVLYGLTMDRISAGCGGGHESGTPMMTTGADVPGTRSNGGEADDGAAGGPSFDQIFKNRVPELDAGGIGYVNALCDARVDSQETSTQCLSYGYTTRSIAAARQANCGEGGQITEAVPLLPELSPAQLYMQLFSGFTPGEQTDGGGDNTDLIKALAMRKSVLDYSLDELATLQTMAPSSEASKIEQHASVIRAVETQLSDQIANGGGVAMGCVVPEAPPNVMGETGSEFNYTNPGTGTSDEDVHRQVGELHSSIIRAAFQCDLIRVATFQWSPGTNHVSFGGLYPDDPNAIYMHHPLSHRIGSRNDVMSSQPGGELGSVVEFLVEVQKWYNTRTAELVNSFKNATDVFGGNLLDHTIIPYVTEVAETTHSRSPVPAMIFGGAALGMQHGQFLNFENQSRHHNDLWMTIAQAYLKTNDPVSMLSDEVFSKQGVSPIDGLWQAV